MSHGKKGIMVCVLRNRLRKILGKERAKITYAKKRIALMCMCLEELESMNFFGRKPISYFERKYKARWLRLH